MADGYGATASLLQTAAAAGLSEGGGRPTYELFGVVDHLGGDAAEGQVPGQQTGRAGHFTATVRVDHDAVSGGDAWVCFDDTRVRSCAGSGGSPVTKDTYIVFYARSD